MTLRLGDTVPNFTQASSEGEINFYDWAGDSWVVLFSHPKDYTPVAPQNSVQWPVSSLNLKSGVSKPLPSASMMWILTWAGLKILRKLKMSPSIIRF